jgi:hypothetical protein
MHEMLGRRQLINVYVDKIKNLLHMVGVLYCM